MSTLVAASPELKRLWIQVLKRVHPDLAIDEQDRRLRERLTQQANEAFARRDEVSLRAVLEGPPTLRHAPSDARPARAQAQQATTPQQSTYQPPLVPQPPRRVTGREASGILWAACAVICLLLYGIFDALSEAVGRKTSLSFLVLLTAALLWLITKNSKLSYDHKVRWVAAVAGGMILILTGLLGSHPRVNPLFPSARAATAQAQAFPVASISSDNLPTSQRYWGVVKTKVGQSWNPSAVANIPAGATADIAFTISLDGSPHNVQLRKPSGYPSLDSSCVLAVQKVKTFGPPEGGAKDGLNVLYPCSYNELASMNAHALQGNTVQENATVLPSRPESAESIASQLGGYTEAAKNKVAQKWDLSEVAGSTPAGATVYMQFAIRRRGTHEVPTVQTPSGYLSLDVSCQAAVDRIQNFGPLPKAYGGDSLTVLYHCTYPGSSTAKIAQDSSLPAVQPTPANGTVNSGHGVQQPANDTVVKN